MNLNLQDSPKRMDPTERWTTTDASELYDVPAWGKGYFSVGTNGHMYVHPNKETSRSVDLKELVDTTNEKDESKIRTLLQVFASEKPSNIKMIKEAHWQNV